MSYTVDVFNATCNDLIDRLNYYFDDPKNLNGNTRQIIAQLKCVFEMLKKTSADRKDDWESPDTLLGLSEVLSIVHDRVQVAFLKASLADAAMSVLDLEFDNMAT